MRFWLVSLVMLAPLSSMAIPGLGGSITRPEPPPALSERGMAVAEMEQMIGGKLTAIERQQLNVLFNQYEEIQSRPQNVAWKVGSVQFAPLACFQFRFDTANIIPNANLRELIRKYISFSGEAQPCLDLSTMTGIMLAGASLVTNGGPGALQAGVQVGVYVGPSHLNKPMVGEYHFVRGSMPFFGIFKGQVTFAADKDRCIFAEVSRGKMGDCQVIVVGGAGVDLFSFISGLWKGTIRQAMNAPAAPAEPRGKINSWGDWLVDAIQRLNKSGFELSVGKLVTVEEIPREKILQMYQEYKRMAREQLDRIRSPRKIAGN